MTVEQVCIGLAALLLVLSCTLLRGGFCAGGRGRNGGRLPALFQYLIMIWLGMATGAIRMESEEWIVRAEQKVIIETAGHEVWMTGQVTGIQSMDYGVRLQLDDCKLCADSSKEECSAQNASSVRKMYVYTDSADNLRLGMQMDARGTCEIPEPDRNPGGFDYRRYCLSKGIAGIFQADTFRFEAEFSDPISPLTRWEERYWDLRESIRQMGLALERKLEEIAEPEDLGILKAVLLGQKMDMDEELYELYRKNGISHVLAISGLHVSVIGMGLWKGLRKLGLGYLQAGSIAFTVLFGYGVMVGFGPSVVRAVFMMGVSFFAGILGRTYDLPSAMCVPALGILLWKPYMLTQASFQLSFLAVGAMFVPGNVLSRKWELKGVAENIWVSVSLQTVTLPFVLLHSYEVPLFGILLNFFVVPLMSYVLISGIFGVAGSFVWYGLGMILLGGAHLILELYQGLCQGFQQIPGANLILGTPEVWKILVYYGLVLIGTCQAFRSGKQWLLLWGIGILVLTSRLDTGFSVTVLDVGQGDGIVLEAEGKTMLVDCGSSQNREIGIDVLVPFFMSQGIRRLDTIVVTHGDQDHMSGIRELLKKPDCEIRIGQMIFSTAGKGDSVCEELASLAEKQGIPVRYCEAGDVLTGALGENVEILCLHPTVRREHGGEQTEDRNGESVVLYISYAEFSMLLTGDIGIEEERALMEQYELSSVTLLKAAHHGSANSNSREFLETVKPAYVIFSYGEGNSYGHPASGVVDACEELGVQVYETAKSGAIRLWTDGTYLRIEGWLDRADGI